MTDYISDLIDRFSKTTPYFVANNYNYKYKNILCLICNQKTENKLIFDTRFNEGFNLLIWAYELRKNIAIDTFMENGLFYGFCSVDCFKKAVHENKDIIVEMITK